MEDNNVIDQNNRLTVVLASEVGDDKGEDLDAPEDGALNVNQMATFPTTSLPLFEANVPILLL